MNLKDISPVIKIPVDQLSAIEIINGRMEYSDKKITWAARITNSAIITYCINGIIRVFSKRILFLEPNSDLIRLV